MVKFNTKSRDYRDIVYMIRHVPFITARIDILRKLGYTVGLTQVDNKFIRKLGEPFQGKNRKFYIPIAYPQKGAKFFYCVII